MFKTKTYLISLFIGISTITFGQGSMNVELLDNWFEDSLINNSTKVRFNDCWGYQLQGIDSYIEFAIAGSTEGIHFFQISDEGQFVPLDYIPGKYSSTMVIHRDIKTYQHYAYAVCDEGNSSLQIIDLSTIATTGKVTLAAEDSLNFARVHNLFIDEENALMYACSVTPSNGVMLQPMKSMQVYSLADPENPTLVFDGPTDIPEVHDCYVRNNIAYLNCGFDGIRVYDFSVPSSPVFLQNLNFYQDQGYSHQGWLTPDGSRYIFGDETSGKKLKNCEVNSDHTITIKNRFGTNTENGSVPHNIWLTNEFAFVAYYNEGLRIYDITQPLPKEIAHYDTYPIEEPLFKMQGAWGMYAGFRSDRLLVSDRHYGLFLFEFDRDVFSVQNTNDLVVFPNPISSSDYLTIKISEEEFEDLQVELFDVAGKKVARTPIIDQSYIKLLPPQSAGIYTVRVSYTNYVNDRIEYAEKIIVY